MSVVTPDTDVFSPENSEFKVHYFSQELLKFRTKEY